MAVNFLVVVFIIVILYCLIKNNILIKDKEWSFLSRESTGTLRGAAIVAIVFSHICQDAPELKGILFGGKYTYTLLFIGGGIGVAIFSCYQVMAVISQLEKQRTNMYGLLSI